MLEADSVFMLSSVVILLVSNLRPGVIQGGERRRFLLILFFARRNAGNSLVSSFHN